MEVFWLIVGIATSIIAIKKIIEIGFSQESLFFVLPPIVSFIMWYMRRRFRKNTENN